MATYNCVRRGDHVVYTPVNIEAIDRGYPFDGNLVEADLSKLEMGIRPGSAVRVPIALAIRKHLPLPGGGNPHV